MSTPYESEVAAVSGIDESGRVAQYSYQTWRDKQPYPVVPADYAGTADLFKWGGAQPGTGATTRPPTGTPTSATLSKAPWRCGRRSPMS